MLARGFKQYADVQIQADGQDAMVGFKVNKVRGSIQLTGYWRFPDGEWTRLNDRPVCGKGAKARLVKMGQEALEAAAKAMRLERQFRESIVFVICGPSCGGKSTLKDTLIGRHRNKFQHVATTTTRQHRSGEADGIDYNFVSHEVFQRKLERGEFLECDKVNGEYYGIAKEDLEAASKKGKSPIIVATPAGIKPVKNWCKEAGKELTTVFVTAPAKVLIERMILRFRRDSEASATAYAGRLDRLMQEELRWQEGRSFDILDEASSLASRERTVSRILGSCEVGLLRYRLRNEGLNDNEQGRLLG